MSRRILASLGRLAVAAALVSVAWVPLGAQTAGKGSQNAAGKSAIFCMTLGRPMPRRPT